jgi:hypothetical protein
MKLLISLLVLIHAVACASNSRAPITRQQNSGGANNMAPASENQPTPPTVSPVPQDSPIRKIDFNNFTFDWYPTWADAPATGRRIILNNGEMNLDFDYGKEPRKFFLIDEGVKYGDLTGDGNEEAVLVLRIITSGTARSNLVFVYIISEQRPKRLWVYETGDRWDYGYHAASINNGQLIVERYKPSVIEYQGKKHGMPSSDTYLRDYYKWGGSQFRRVHTEAVPADSSDSAPWVRRI